MSNIRPMKNSALEGLGPTPQLSYNRLISTKEVDHDLYALRLLRGLPRCDLRR